MSFDVEVTYRTRAAQLWVMAMRAASLVVGEDRAIRWAQAGMLRLIRYRIGRGPWRALPPGFLT